MTHSASVHFLEGKRGQWSLFLQGIFSSTVIKVKRIHGESIDVLFGLRVEESRVERSTYIVSLILGSLFSSDVEVFERSTYQLLLYLGSSFCVAVNHC